jgi:hypothetical protein
MRARELPRHRAVEDRVPGARGWIRWVTLIVVVAAIDLAARFALPFDLTRVLVVETVLFLGTALAMATLISRAPPRRRWLRVLLWVFAWSFALAAVRTGIWAAGQPVTRANAIVLALGVIVLVAAWVRHQRRRP